MLFMPPLLINEIHLMACILIKIKIHTRISTLPHFLPGNAMMLFSVLSDSLHSPKDAKMKNQSM